MCTQKPTLTFWCLHVRHFSQWTASTNKFCHFLAELLFVNIFDLIKKAVLTKQSFNFLSFYITHFHTTWSKIIQFATSYKCHIFSNFRCNYCGRANAQHQGLSCGFYTGAVCCLWATRSWNISQHTLGGNPFDRSPVHHTANAHPDLKMIWSYNSTWSSCLWNVRGN